MSKRKRKNQIHQELATLKIDLNSNYGVILQEEKRYQKIFDRMVKLKEELKSLNKDE
tara:strand:- start:374 stop:544 length:171 start_codon:yes stop_codon:yes gene_type:complete